MLALVSAQRSGQSAHPDPELASRVELHLIDPDGRSRLQPLDGRAVDGFRAEARWQPMIGAPGIDLAYRVEFSVTAQRSHAGLGVQIVLPLMEPATRFMVPGIVHGENRLPECKGRYPRVAPTGDALTSEHWSFRADRASHPVVFAWTGSACIALAADDEVSMLGLNGLGFRGGAASCLLLNFPAREEPVTYLGRDAPAPAEVLTHSWEADETVTLAFQVFVAGPDRHAYDAVLRALYRRDQARHELRPWMSMEQAAELAAHGLHRWHYHPGPQILAETASFDGGNDENAPTGRDREWMRAACLSGAPSAYALLTYGHSKESADYVEAAVGVLDTIAGGLTPCGHSDGISSRTAAEATLFMTRALRFEESRGVSHPAWKEAIGSNLRYALRAQREGAFPAMINRPSGSGERRAGAAGLLWIPALLEGESEVDVLELHTAAEAAGSFYAQFIDDEFVCGAADGIDLGPSSEAGYDAVMAYVALYERRHEPRWLTLACRAADWMLSFRWSHNLAFPQHTLLGAYDFRSRGADLASPRQQHLHGSGLICLPEMVRLARHTGDRYYLDRTRDNLACFLQFVAREDGDFNARKGMVTERYYHTRSLGTKGTIQPISHAWSAGLVLYACQSGLALDD